MPIYVRLGMHLLYIGKRQRKLLGHSKINELLKNQSINMGKKYDSTIRPLEHINEFIETYEIEMGDLLEPDPAKYKSFNEFFYRKLKPDARPIAHPERDQVISSVADCRLTVFETIEEAQTFWIKVRSFVFIHPASSSLRSTLLCSGR